MVNLKLPRIPQSYSSEALSHTQHSQSQTHRCSNMIVPNQQQGFLCFVYKTLQWLHLTNTYMVAILRFLPSVVSCSFSRRHLSNNRWTWPVEEQQCRDDMLKRILQKDDQYIRVTSSTMLLCWIQIKQLPVPPIDWCFETKSLLKNLFKPTLCVLPNFFPNRNAC